MKDLEARIWYSKRHTLDKPAEEQIQCMVNLDAYRLMSRGIRHPIHVGSIGVELTNHLIALFFDYVDRNYEVSE